MVDQHRLLQSGSLVKLKAEPIARRVGGLEDADELPALNKRQTQSMAKNERKTSWPAGTLSTTLQ